MRCFFSGHVRTVDDTLDTSWPNLINSDVTPQDMFRISVYSVSKQLLIPDRIYRKKGILFTSISTVNYVLEFFPIYL